VQPRLVSRWSKGRDLLPEPVLARVEELVVAHHEDGSPRAERLRPCWTRWLSRLLAWRQLFGHEPSAGLRAYTLKEALSFCGADEVEARNQIRLAYERGNVCVGNVDSKGQLAAYVWVPLDLFDGPGQETAAQPRSEATRDATPAAPFVARGMRLRRA
jgi:hypothetical protein